MSSPFKYLKITSLFAGSEEIQAFIEKQEIFDRSLSLADIVGQANMAANGGKPDVHRVPYSRAQISRYLLLHSPLDLAPYVSHDYRRANIVVFHNVADSSTLNRYVRELREAVSAYAGVEMTSSIVGENLMINAAADRLVDGQLMAFVFLLLLSLPSLKCRRQSRNFLLWRLAFLAR